MISYKLLSLWDTLKNVHHWFILVHMLNFLEIKNILTFTLYVRNKTTSNEAQFLFVQVTSYRNHSCVYEFRKHW